MRRIEDWRKIFDVCLPVVLRDSTSYLHITLGVGTKHLHQQHHTSSKYAQDKPAKYLKYMCEY